MLYIRTGLMGHGKTLNTIKEVDTSAYAQDRPVYFHNVTDLQPDKLQAKWYQFDDPHLWFDLPDNAIIVVDEAQGWFGVRDPRKEVPRYASEFEIMRKKGHEVHLITQDPRFIDVHVRRLCNKHIHYWRIFGSSKLSRYEMERCVNDVEKLASNKEATRTFPTLDRRYFGVYTSAKAGHHFKFKPSKKAMMFGAAALVAVVLCWRAYDRIWAPKPVEATADAPAKSLQQSVTDAAKSFMPSVVPDATKPTTRADYIAQSKPRIAGVPSTAPIYDDLTKPKAAPKLYCVTSSDSRLVERQGSAMSVGYIEGRVSVCQCYTQQGTRVASEFEFCAAVASGGYFDASVPDRNTAQVGGGGFRQQQEPASVGGSAQFQAVSSQPVVSQARVSVVPYEKAKFLW
ncbi:zonular occludens toxin domain-containing protein [Pseudomonas sp. PS02288]|uniref:zonular occludens toxin domain-containing protein n=1 Tax=Pseudomonas sp. PS02288 TaxID=2991443 RepID=UPI00249B7CE1|nr:zonular occludens toxin domain-containing protein [Pseudomonas sp. PS02288]